MKNSNFNRAYLRTLNLIKEDPDLNAEADEMMDATAPTGEEGMPLQQVCFKTSDQALIDAVNSGFEEVVFFVKSTDEDGEETVEEVKIKPESFTDIQVTEVTDDEETPDMIGEDPDLDAEGDTIDQDPDGIDEGDEDGEDETKEEGDEKVCPDCGKPEKECECKKQGDDEGDKEEEAKECGQVDECGDDQVDECNKPGKFLGRKPASAFESVLSRIKKKYVL